MPETSTLKKIIGSIGFVLLCLAVLAFPFSVAASNICLAGVLIAGVLDGELKQGLCLMWRKQRWLSILWLAYLTLFPLGLLWSLDIDRGLQIIGRQWFWLLLPLLIQVVARPERRNMFFMSLSLGLGLHLVFCLAQYFGLVVLIDKAGSTAENPTGHIGHTSFGLVYALWAAFLVQWSLFLPDWKRWLARGVALWAVGMIFLSSGRGGYLVLAAVLLTMMWKLARLSPLLRTASASLMILAMLAVLSIGPGKERMLVTWQSIQAIQHGNFQNPEARWSLWYAAIESWRQHLPLGVGTGGYHVAAEQVRVQHTDLFLPPSPAHPHSMFLQSLSRWGPPGVLILMALFFLWIREGWRTDWRSDPAAGLIALSGIAMLVQGMTEPSFEEHFPGVLAALLCGAGLAALYGPHESPGHTQGNASTT
ncbi:MAG: O-antigen ligase family protein [Mariprofundaceae bacterium]|nr:O-antigen ligase family protein [Mariprofundaceae bacterium]